MPAPGVLFRGEDVPVTGDDDVTVATGGETVARLSAHCNDRFPVCVVSARPPPLQPDSVSGLSDGGFQHAQRDQPFQLIEEHCQLRAGNGYLATDKLAFLQAFGEQAQIISPEDFDGVTLKINRRLEKGSSSSICCTCSPGPLKTLRISVTPATSQGFVQDGIEIIETS